MYRVFIAKGCGRVIAISARSYGFLSRIEQNTVVKAKANQKTVPEDKNQNQDQDQEINKYVSEFQRFFLLRQAIENYKMLIDRRTIRRTKVYTGIAGLLLAGGTYTQSKRWH